jgi:hypothetical protein
MAVCIKSLVVIITTHALQQMPNVSAPSSIVGSRIRGGSRSDVVNFNGKAQRQSTGRSGGRLLLPVLFPQLFRRRSSWSSWSMGWLITSYPRWELGGRSLSARCKLNQLGE